MKQKQFYIDYIKNIALSVKHFMSLNEQSEQCSLLH